MKQSLLPLALLLAGCYGNLPVDLGGGSGGGKMIDCKKTPDEPVCKLVPPPTATQPLVVTDSSPNYHRLFAAAVTGATAVSPQCDPRSERCPQPQPAPAPTPTPPTPQPTPAPQPSPQPQPTSDPTRPFPQPQPLPSTEPTADPSQPCPAIPPGNYLVGFKFVRNDVSLADLVAFKTIIGKGEPTVIQQRAVRAGQSSVELRVVLTPQQMHSGITPFAAVGLRSQWKYYGNISFYVFGS